MRAVSLKRRSAMSLADRQRIEQFLNDMRRAPSAEARRRSLRQLLAHLNYSPTEKPLRLDLREEVRSQLAGSPTIIGTGASDAGFLVIQTQLAGATLSRQLERAVVTALLKDYPYALFVFSNSDDSRWHLLNVKIARREMSDDN